jgi:hypothetical protein
MTVAMSYFSPSPSGRGLGVRENRLDVNSSLHACVLECARQAKRDAAFPAQRLPIVFARVPSQKEMGASRPAGSRSPCSASPPNTSSPVIAAIERFRTDFQLPQGDARHKSFSAAPVHLPEIGISLAPGCWNLEVSSILRSCFPHSRCTLCVAKLYPITGYYSLLQPNHIRAKNTPNTTTSTVSMKIINHCPQAACRNSQLKIHHSQFPQKHGKKMRKVHNFVRKKSRCNCAHACHASDPTISRTTTRRI